MTWKRPTPPDVILQTGCQSFGANSNFANSKPGATVQPTNVQSPRLCAACQAWGGTTACGRSPVTRSQPSVTRSRQPPVCTVLPSGENENCVGLRMEQLQTSGDFIVEPQVDLRVGALDDPLHFKTLLHFFNTDQELTRVDLTLDIDSYKSERKDGLALASCAGEAVLN